jgi:hypothetical protein
MTRKRTMHTDLIDIRIIVIGFRHVLLLSRRSNHLVNRPCASSITMENEPETIQQTHRFRWITLSASDAFFMAFAASTFK